MASWKKTITSPFKKACTFFNQQPRDPNKKSQLQENGSSVMDLHGEVMACAYEDVQVMWSILDKSKTTPYKITS
ncbi:SsrA-binding protein [Parasponia andersonii]|uniref:SsrA-binding protein n=1 Tax=Parasponia andersonii TaxID=3476 RepID=A0A2P5CUV4_PARAD|nr:SsrA-binding protein [Parasponia andersonii]